MLDTTTLLQIEARCTREPWSALRGLRERVAQSLPALDAESGAHAAALLLKLEHLERCECAHAAPPQDEVYLAPHLRLDAA